jgi:hypothetical protein
MIAELAVAHPNAKFSLVGHSLGGLVAFRVLDFVVAGILPSGVIESIITLDSPLTGTSISGVLRSLPFPSFSCELAGLLAVTGPVGDDLNTMALNAVVSLNCCDGQIGNDGHNR